MGPFELDDLSGIDIRYHVLKRRLMETGVRSEGYDIIEKLYQEGRYGKKLGTVFTITCSLLALMIFSVLFSLLSYTSYIFYS